MSSHEYQPAGLFHAPLWHLRRRVGGVECVWWAALRPPTTHIPHLKDEHSLDEHEIALINLQGYFMFLFGACGARCGVCQVGGRRAAHLTHSTPERMGLLSLARNLYVCRQAAAAVAL
ncbi:hypothetical protein [Dictyobacter kobayashii]|uniref:hypothetical protein n=1 Tax=Dictyobacter kobayashii TaxID=2014872 RepID=UPI000F83B61A|nr:hypothetical protein [Dictyobacter kobayashii]